MIFYMKNNLENVIKLCQNIPAIVIVSTLCYAILSLSVRIIQVHLYDNYTQIKALHKIVHTYSYRSRKLICCDSN